MRKKYDIWDMKINGRILLCSLLGFLPCFCAQSQGLPELVYGMGFDQRFDNREYDRSDYSSSGTIFGARLTPSLGLKLRVADDVHTITIGAEIRKDFGDINTTGKKLIKDFFYYYSYRTPLGKGVFSIDGGVIPRTKYKESWSTAFLSEKREWYDPYIEGLLFRYESASSNIELGCDWMGMYGSDSSVNEQFMVFSAGHHDFSRLFKMGYNFYMVHFANSVSVRGVCDNILAEPYATLDLAPITGGLLDEASIKLGYIQSLQRDRTVSLDFQNPSLLETSVNIKKKGWEVSNNFYVGEDIMPLYNSVDAAEQIYGDRLYLSDPFFRIYDDTESAQTGFYDRLELGYSKNLGANLILRLSWVCHFNTSSYSGSQQIITLKYLIR